MSVIDTLVTNRTQTDVKTVCDLIQKGFEAMTADEKAQFLQPMKGTYNATDLNRVGNAVRYVADLFASYGYSISVSPKTDYVETDIPTEEQMEGYLADISAIRSALHKPLTPQTPQSMELLNHVRANNIERILKDADELIRNMIASFVYCGQPYCGQIWEGFQ